MDPKIVENIKRLFKILGPIALKQAVPLVVTFILNSDLLKGQTIKDKELLEKSLTNMLMSLVDALSAVEIDVD